MLHPPAISDPTVSPQLVGRIQLMRAAVAAGCFVLSLLGVFGGSSAWVLTGPALFGAYAAVLGAKAEPAQLQTGFWLLFYIDVSIVTIVGLSALHLNSWVLIGLALLLLQAALFGNPRHVVAVAVGAMLVLLGNSLGASPEFSANLNVGRLLAIGALTAAAASWMRQRQQSLGLVLKDLENALGRREEDVATLVREALRNLARDVGCSRALFAYWDEPEDHYSVCQYPLLQDTGHEGFESGRQWVCVRGRKLDFSLNSLPGLTTESGHDIQRTDLDPELVDRLEIENIFSMGLRGSDRDASPPKGRLLLVNFGDKIPTDLRSRVQPVVDALERIVAQQDAVLHAKSVAADEERARIAHDLHDGALQSVISFEMRLGIIRKLFERSPEEAKNEVEQLHGLSRRLVFDVRTFVHRMQPLESEDVSPSAGLRRLAETFQKESGIPVTLLGLNDGDLAIRGPLGAEVVQIAREALHNIYKHANATQVVLGLEKSVKQLHLAVGDNGQGYRFAGKYSLSELDTLRLGPKSIRQRARGMNAELTLESTPGHGSQLKVTIPLY